MTENQERFIEILLVEDTPTDVRLTIEALKRGKLAHHLSVVEDGVEAMAFLRRQGKYARAVRPDLILLDLKLPRKDGHEVLAELKADEGLQDIPVVVLTCSPADVDMLRAYNLKANCYITKPVEFEEFVKLVAQIASFWFSVATLPRFRHSA
jgi:CheY-like chemotaxis protein